MKIIKINDITHQALKMYCAANGVNMQDKADQIIAEFLLREASGIMDTLEWRETRF